MSDIKKWMDIVVGAERLASQLADIQSAATSAIESEESESVSKNNGVTVNLSLDLGDLKNALTGGQTNNSVLPAVQGTIPTVIKQPITRTAAPIQQASSNGRFQENDTVTVLPSVGGGVGRFVGYSKNGACIDIKGVQRELSLDQFCAVDRDSEDPYDSGNDWFHKSIEPYTAGLMKDKPEFRPGDMVKIADVYGAVIGPGFGIFVAYSTTGKECIISFDDKEIIVPTSNVEAVLEQNAKDNFDQMDNDGNLSPISFGSVNRKMEESLEEPAMDQRDEFSKWISAVEEALQSEGKPGLEENIPVMQNQCGCGSWNCPICFPDNEREQGQGMPGAEVGGMPLIGEEDNEFVEKPKSGKGVKLGDIVKKTEFKPTAGHNSPETYGGDNLLAQPRPPRTRDDVEPPRSSLNPEHSPLTDVDETIPTSGQQSPMTYGSDNTKPGRRPRKVDDVEPSRRDPHLSGRDSPLTWGDANVNEYIPHDANPDDYGKAGRYSQDNFGMQGDDDLIVDDGLYDAEPDAFDQDEVVATQMGSEEPSDEVDQEQVQKILNIQAMGFSKDDRHYTRQELLNYTPEELQQCYGRVMGDVAEAPSDIAEPPDRPKPTKTRHHLDDIDDILNPRQDNLPSELPGGGGPIGGGGAAGGPMSLPTSSRADTQRRLAGMTPTDQMRDYMNRINPAAGGDEPELQPTQNELVVRNAADVPAVISSALQASGTQNPEWHTVNNLPGYQQRNIRGMGRQVFSMFTSTPLENIQTLANVNGQGPNTDAEMRAVAGWLRDNAEDLGKVDVSHGMAIPGYQPDVKEYRANGIRFQIVRDPMGQYIYAYPDADARLGAGGGAGGGRQGQLPGQGGGGMPRLRESELKPTLLEQLNWDEEIYEAFMAESTLSRLVGKKKGGQQLVRWLHRKHKLGNEAELEPVKFNKTLMWKQFKSNPDNFVIVSGEGGVAGIKPSQAHIDAMTKKFAKAGKEYNPAGDSTLPYQIIAFTDDGQQVDPELLRPQPEAGDEPGERDVDPTVQKARMGKNIGSDILNPNNTFRLLNDQIGPIHTVWISGFGGYRGDPESVRPAVGSVERGKMAGRADLKKTAELAPQDAVQKIFTRIKPVLKTLANQAILQINKRAQRYIEGGNFEGAQKVAASGQKLKQLLVQLDTNNAINISTQYGSTTMQLSQAIQKAISQAAGAPVGTDPYNEYATSAAQGSISEVRPILDALRDNLVGL